VIAIVAKKKWPSGQAEKYSWAKYQQRKNPPAILNERNDEQNVPDLQPRVSSRHSVQFRTPTYSFTILFCGRFVRSGREVNAAGTFFV
jgi:hypothetical protein